MGCDIHAHFEIKLNGKWEHYSHPRIQRNYRLFAVLADVRNEDTRYSTIADVKGLPSDLSITTELCAKQWEGDGHSHTWLNAYELHNLFESEFIKKDGELEFREIGYLFGNGWGSFTKYPESYPTEIEDIRFICWFDN